ncbi:MAG: hypothetical protein P1U85_13515 [Verrucomicrobiales bacterium]|jgi:hypothetical protein|nr:hypothetical protein [Verrucomicrobiales bacterium]
MEKAIIVAVDLTEKRGKSEEGALAELNQLLREGWTVKSATAMGGTGHVIAASLVILVKE